MKPTVIKALAMLLALVLVLGTLLTACQKPDEEPDPTPDQSQDGEQTPDQPENPDGGKEDDMDQYVKLSEKGQKLYDATYKTMLDRLHENGYAQTSLTGAYQGMFVRDASIQVMAHIAEGDMDEAMSILRFMASYHKATNAPFAHHIMSELTANSVWDYIDKDMSYEAPELGKVGTSVSSEDTSIALYKINMPTNGCAQKIMLPFDNVSEISVYLELAGKEGEIVVSLGTEPGDDSIGKISRDIADLGSGKDWYTFKFDEPVDVEAGEKYVLSVWAENATGNIISFGKTSGGSGYNFDVPAFGGWVSNGQVIGYRIRTDNSLVGKGNAVTQTFVAKGDVIDTIEIDATCSVETNLYGALVDADGKEVKTATVKMSGGKVAFDFGSVKVTEGKTYGLSVYAEKGDVVWATAAAATVAYKSADSDKAPLGETYALRVYPEYSGTRTAVGVKVGGGVEAKQTLSSTLNSKLVTSAQLYLAAVGTAAAEDTFTVSLYKGDALISEVTRPVSTLGSKAAAYNFEFALPMSKLNADEAYSIQIGASRAESVQWFGKAGIDRAQACHVDGKAQELVLSYRAGISNVTPISTKIQVDGNYMWMNAFAMFALESGEEYGEFLDSVYDLMIEYTRYFLDNGYIHENGLVHNPNYEHSRKGRYWDGYDLITNCFASEALHKMSQVAKMYGDNAVADEFAKAADDIAEAVHTELVSEFEGKPIYTELIALDEGGAVYRGFSFVNLAPIASDWYAVNEEIMANTYEAYLKIGTQKYSGIDMLAVVVDVNDKDQATYHGNHVIGKGLGWELYYLWKTGNTERLNDVLEFVDKRSNEIYPETWVADGRLADSGNQEQASWILFEVARITGKYQK